MISSICSPTPLIPSVSTIFEPFPFLAHLLQQMFFENFLNSFRTDRGPPFSLNSLICPICAFIHGSLSRCLVFRQIHIVFYVLYDLRRPFVIGFYSGAPVRFFINTAALGLISPILPRAYRGFMPLRGVPGS